MIEYWLPGNYIGVCLAIQNRLKRWRMGVWLYHRVTQRYHRDSQRGLGIDDWGLMIDDW